MKHYHIKSPVSFHRYQFCRYQGFSSTINLTMKLLGFSFLLLAIMVCNMTAKLTIYTRPTYRRITTRLVKRRMKEAAVRQVHRMAMILKRKNLI